MKIKPGHLIFILLVVLVQSLPAQRVKRTGEELIPPNLLLEDLRQLKGWITEAHGDPYRFTTEKALTQRFLDAEKQIKSVEQMTGIRFFGLLLPIMAELRDGHSKVLPPDLDHFYGATILPLGLHFYQERPFVLDNMGQESIPLGAELLEINNQRVDQFFRQIIDQMSRDGNVRSSRHQKLENALFLANLMKGLGVDKEEYLIKYQKGEDIKTVTLKGIDQATYKQVRSKSIAQPRKRQPMSLEIPEESASTAVLTIRSFNPGYFKNSQQEFDRQLDELMLQVREESIDHLIIDLRGNTGGEDTYNAYLLRYFMKEDFRLYGEINAQKGNYKFLPDGHHWDIDPRAFVPREDGRFDVTRYLWEDPDNHGLKTFSPLENRYSGKVYVLTDGYTFSAAAEAASFFKHYQLATVIGEETGGSSIGTVAGYTPTFTLKNSGVHVNLSLISIKRSFFEDAWTDRGVMPDVALAATVQDRLEGRDVVLERAYELIRKKH